MSKWSCEDEKRFQVALLCYPEDFPKRWEKIAEVVGFSKEIVYQRYQILQIELDQVSPPQDTNSSTNNQPHKNNKCSLWTLEEHALFLLGEQKYGRGHWKNISEKAVGTRNRTQVTSHAQKFYIRQREKETIVHSRGSIHDFTLANYPPEYLKYLLSSRPHLMLGSCMIMQQPNTSIHRHLALHNDHHSLPVTQLGTQIPSTLYQSHQDALPTHYDHLGIEGKAEDLSSIRGNTHPGVSDEVMDEKDTNVNDIRDNEQGNTTAGSSPSQREDLKSGNTHVSTDEITGQSPVPPNEALLGASVDDIGHSSVSGLFESPKRKWFPEGGNSFDGLNTNLVDGSDTDDDSSSSTSFSEFGINKVQLSPDFLFSTGGKRRKT